MVTTVTDDIRTRSVRCTPFDPVTGAVVAPICQSTTFAQPAVGVDRGYTYSRAGNPTVYALECALGALEDAPPGVCFGAGMAATAALCLALLKSGDHVVVSDVAYGGTIRLLREVLSRFGVDASFVDSSDVAAVGEAIGDRTRLILIETPANPTLKLADIAAIADVARIRGVPLAVDNTFLTAALQRPLDLGADISLYSTTKFIEGHNSTVGGAIVTRNESLLDELRFISKSIGVIQSPFEAWLTTRGIKTLPLRIREHSANALQVAQWLEDDPRIEQVNYPFLESFAQNELATRQQGAGGGVLSFEVRGGTEAGIALLNNVELCILAENLGATETLITHPVSMTHGDVPREQRLATGITDGLVRLSVGLENPEDVIADLDQALAIATEGKWGQESSRSDDPSPPGADDDALSKTPVPFFQTGGAA